MNLDLTVVMYHYVRDPGDAATGDSEISGLPRATFEAQLDLLARRHSMVSWSDVKSNLLDDAPLPPDPCLLTFDDGMCDHCLNVFPILRSRNLSGLFFVMARPDGSGLTLPHRLHFLIPRLGVDALRQAVWDRLDSAQQAKFSQTEAYYRAQWQLEGVNLLKAILQRDLAADVDSITRDLVAEHVGDEIAIARAYYLTRAQMFEMRAGGMSLGGHSETHPWFDFIAAAPRDREIQASSAWLRDLESAPYAFAYPYGGLSPEAPAQLQAHGFVAAFTTVPQTLQVDPFYIGRFDGEEMLVPDLRGF